MTVSEGRDRPLHERVVAFDAGLAPTERTVAAFLAEHPDRAAVASAAELGELTGTSNATVVRTVKKLGYAGLPELRRVLLETIVARRNPARVLGERIDRLTSSPSDNAADRVLVATIDLLEQARHLVDDASWTRAIDILAEAESVLCYGNGQAGGVAEYLSIELLWNGRAARCLKSTGLDLSTGLLSLQGNQAVVLIAPLRHFREVDVVIDRATEVGAPVILMSEALGMTLADRVDVVLATPQSTLTPTSEVLAPMTLAHALALDLAARDRRRAVATYELVTNLRAQVVGAELDVSPPPRVKRGKGKRARKE